MSKIDTIDWGSSQTHILLNPRMPVKEKKDVLAALESTNSLPAHIWLATSGSSGYLKYVALSKKAILISAAAVNHHLQSDPSDIWINPLPAFHIGGLAIKARGYLAGMKVIEPEFFGGHWDPHQFVENIITFKATLTALVPTQIYDLVTQKLKAPPSLRAVVVGGGALSELVYEQAINLGWNVLPSYGSTECASQVATAPLFSWNSGCFPLLHPLDHVKISLDSEGVFRIGGESLLTCYGFPDVFSKTCELKDPKIEGWFATEDKVILENGSIRSISRSENFVKIGGESVDLARLNQILDELRFSLQVTYDMTIFAIPDDRLGHIIHLAVASEYYIDLDILLKNFDDRVHPFERIRQVHYVDNILRTPLNKVIRHQFLIID
jgi:O-succinylbenzoic acid--CoA ligase